MKWEVVRSIVMKENIVQKLTSKDDKYACAFTDRIVAESHDTDEWYKYFEDVASLLDHPKSLVKAHHRQTMCKGTCSSGTGKAAVYTANSVCSAQR